MVILTVFCTISGLLFADGGAERPITADEKAFYETTYQKILELLPEAQQGTTKEVEELSVPTSRGVGAENYPTQFDISCEYRGEMSMQETMEAGAMMANDSSGLEDMSDQMSKISEEIQKAAEAGDQKKMVELQAEMQAVLQGNAGMAKLQKTAADLEKKSMRMYVSVNANGADFHPYKEIPAPSGAGIAIRRDKKEDLNSDTVLFFGPYTKKVYEETQQIYVKHEKASPTKVHYFYISLQGEPEVCDAYIAKMNLAGFAALIK
jgi:hypothetical protein